MLCVAANGWLVSVSSFAMFLCVSFHSFVLCVVDDNKLLFSWTAFGWAISCDQSMSAGFGE